ncbi:hypothetical protein AAGF08_20075 [Algoriphagus sp. SE2]|uniref:hypothetical protein n=1 Tax=Algoriphagus sp. SE2 TaxID=3141536 RepID=UPI0031CD9CE1
MKTIFESFKYTDFIDSLDPTLKSAVYKLETSGISLEAIGTEISSMPAIGMTTKGVNNWDKTIFQKILSEVAKLICDESTESELAKQLKAEAGISTQIIIAGVSTYVGSKLGFAAALCSPFVVLSIAIILKAGLNVFCNTFKP